MRDKVVNNLIIKIKEKNSNFDEIKLSEIRYGLQGLYTLVTKSFVTILLAIIFNIVFEFFLTLLFYIPLRSLGFGTHAKSNMQCWIFSILFLLLFPYLFNIININILLKIIIWLLCFINLVIFSPADTKKRPMINRVRKLKFKIGIIILSVIYLILIFIFNELSNLILYSLLLEGFLVNPLGYILMGEKVRFSLN